MLREKSESENKLELTSLKVKELPSEEKSELKKI